MGLIFNCWVIVILCVDFIFWMMWYIVVWKGMIMNMIVMDVVIKCWWCRVIIIFVIVKKVVFRLIFCKIWGIMGYCIFLVVNKIIGIWWILISGINWDMLVDGKV